MRELGCQSGFRAREAGLHGAGRHTEHCCGILLGKAVKHAQGDDSLVGGRQRSQRVLRISVTDRVGVIGAMRFWRKAIEQGAMPTRAAAEVARHVGRSDEEPGQCRVLNEANGLPATPRLKEGDGDGVVRVTRRTYQAHNVAIEAVTVTVEDSAEGFALSGESQRPIICIGASGHTCIVRPRWIGSICDRIPS